MNDPSDAPAPGRTPATKPSSVERIIAGVQNLSIAQLGVMRPMLTLASFPSPEPSPRCSRKMNTSDSANSPTIATRKSMPSYRCTSPNEKRGTPVWPSTPIIAIPRPSAAANAALAWLVDDTPPSVAKASANSAKYSAGPNSSATRTSSGARNTNPIVANSDPTNDAMPEIASASPARPCLRHGIAVQRGHQRRLVAGNVQQDRRDAAAIHRAIVNRRQQDQRRRRAQPQRERQAGSGWPRRSTAPAPAARR